MTETHPIQLSPNRRNEQFGKLNQAVTLAAYEVYTHLYGSQEAMVTGGCRGGFGVGEILAFLYARSFPKAEWEQRVFEAQQGMVLGDRNI